MTEDKPNGGPEAPAPDTDELKAKLVRETARAPWTELQRFYARGQVAYAKPGLDLIDVAVAVAQDDKDQVQAWLEQGLFGEVSAAEAQAWFDRDASLWTVVVAPWVLVQEDAGSESKGGSVHLIH